MDTDKLGPSCHRTHTADRVVVAATAGWTTDPALKRSLRSEETLGEGTGSLRTKRHLKRQYTGWLKKFYGTYDASEPSGSDYIVSLVARCLISFRSCRTGVC